MKKRTKGNKAKVKKWKPEELVVSLKKIHTE